MLGNLSFDRIARGTLRKPFSGSAVSLTLAVVLTAAAVPAIAKRHPGGLQVRVVERQAVVQAAATATYSAQCPRAYPHPAGPEFGVLTGSTRGSVALAGSYPKGQRGWVDVVKNLSNQPQGYFAGIVCLSAQAKFEYPRSTFVVHSGYDYTSVPCPRSAPNAFNGYFGPQSASDLGKGLLADLGSYKQHKRLGEDIGIRNSSGAPLGLFGGAICTSLDIWHWTYNSTVTAGMDDSGTVSCQHGPPVPIAGYVFPNGTMSDGTLVMSTTFPAGRRWVVGVRSLTDHAVRYSGGIICAG